MKEFIDENAKSFPKLEVLYINGQRPQLVMVMDGDVDAAEDSEEQTSITSWNRDTMIDYLEEKLGKDA